MTWVLLWAIWFNDGTRLSGSPQPHFQTEDACEAAKKTFDPGIIFTDGRLWCQCFPIDEISRESP